MGYAPGIRHQRAHESTNELKQASGNLGSIILPALLRDFEVTIVTRSSSSASYPDNVKVIKIDYTEDELLRVFQGQDAIVSAVGPTGFLEQKAFIDAAIKASVMRFVPSEYSSSTVNDVARQVVPVFEYKKQVLDYLREKESTGLTWTGLATGPLLDWVSSSVILPARCVSEIFVRASVLGSWALI